MGKLTGKGKHTVNVENHLHTSMISKLTIREEESKKAGYWKYKETNNLKQSCIKKETAISKPNGSGK